MDVLLGSFIPAFSTTFKIGWPGAYWALILGFPLFLSGNSLMDKGAWCTVELVAILLVPAGNMVGFVGPSVVACLSSIHLALFASQMIGVSQLWTSLHLDSTNYYWWSIPKLVGWRESSIFLWHVYHMYCNPAWLWVMLWLLHCCVEAWWWLEELFSMTYSTEALLMMISSS